MVKLWTCGYGRGGLPSHLYNAQEIIACHTTLEEVLPIARQFGEWWNFHHAVGALDGYYNYKGFLFIILLTLVDTDYNVIWVDVVAKGCVSNATVFNKLKEVIKDSIVALPCPTHLPIYDQKIPYFIVGDEALP